MGYYIEASLGERGERGITGKVGGTGFVTSIIKVEWKKKLD